MNEKTKFWILLGLLAASILLLLAASSLLDGTELLR